TSWRAAKVIGYVDSLSSLATQPLPRRLTPDTWYPRFPPVDRPLSAVYRHLSAYCPLPTAFCLPPFPSLAF
ncbi:MAG TPA: hypothetical protein VKO18_16050, partial [Terriglobia bacterium]|nr:hypothetical protein [Terriglobia bacterium]